MRMQFSDAIYTLEAHVRMNYGEELILHLTADHKLDAEMVRVISGCEQDHPGITARFHVSVHPAAYHQPHDLEVTR